MIKAWVYVGCQRCLVVAGPEGKQLVSIPEKGKERGRDGLRKLRGV